MSESLPKWVPPKKGGRWPARLHVLLARSADVAVVFRRGPTKQVLTLRWDLERDKFTKGQWFKGRLFELKSDLSPDGKHLLYFASKQKIRDDSPATWTAISAAPYLKALVMYKNGTTYGGGGLWTSNKTYWMDDIVGEVLYRDNPRFHRDVDWKPDQHYNGEGLNTYYSRLMRDQWSLITLFEQIREWQHLSTFEKSLSYGWALRKIAHIGGLSPRGGGYYWDEHKLVHQDSGVVESYPDWEWADWDRRRKRLLWATGGCLYTAKIGSEGLVDPRMIVDLNDYEFEELIAPY